MTNIKDLAKMAGVSVTTVSRVLNNHPYVSEEKRNAVLEAIKVSNYHKNINAVHLSKGKTQLMDVVLPFSDHPYFALLLKGIANDELAIIGFDNQPIAKMMNITTIDLPLEEMGNSLFLQAVNGDVSNKEMSVELIERGTV